MDYGADICIEREGEEKRREEKRREERERENREVRKVGD